MCIRDSIYTSLDAFDRCLLVVGRVTDVSTAGDYFPPVRQKSPPGYYYSGNPFPAKPDQIYRPHSVFYQGRLIQRARRIQGPQASGAPNSPCVNFSSRFHHDWDLTVHCGMVQRTTAPTREIACHGAPSAWRTQWRAQSPQTR